MIKNREDVPGIKHHVKNPENTTQIFNQYRALLFSIAYRMLCNATDAEDIVQEAFVRWLQASDGEIQSPKAFLSTVATRLCIDQLRSARARRELYVGPWLPEPIPTDQRQDLTETAILGESLSFAFLVMLESLGPLERAVFLLREVFDYDYAEIAAIVGKSEAYCWQMMSFLSRTAVARPGAAPNPFMEPITWLAVCLVVAASCRLAYRAASKRSTGSQPSWDTTMAALSLSCSWILKESAFATSTRLRTPTSCTASGLATELPRSGKRHHDIMLEQP